MKKENSRWENNRRMILNSLKSLKDRMMCEPICPQKYCLSYLLRDGHDPALGTNHLISLGGSEVPAGSLLRFSFHCTSYAFLSHLRRATRRALGARTKAKAVLTCHT